MKTLGTVSRATMGFADESAVCSELDIAEVGGKSLDRYYNPITGNENQ